MASRQPTPFRYVESVIEANEVRTAFTRVQEIGLELP